MASTFFIGLIQLSRKSKVSILNNDFARRGYSPTRRTVTLAEVWQGYRPSIIYEMGEDTAAADFRAQAPFGERS